MKEVNAEIIAVGSELLLGQIANTNAQWLSEQMADLGINVHFHHTVGDNFGRLEAVMQLAQSRSDLVLVTGGLGPTEDDLTREVGANVLNKSLTTDQTVMNKIMSYFKRNDIQMSENNRKQALVFDSSTVFENQEGMAPGMFVEHSGTDWVFLPGVPREMKHIYDERVVPFLRVRYTLQQKIVSRVLKFIGIGESILEDRLADIIQKQTNPTIAPLAGEGEVTLRLTAKADTEESALSMISVLQNQVLDRVGEYFYGLDHDTIPSKVIDLIKKQQFTLASAESLTGGRFSDQIISVPGASTIFPGSLVCYQPTIKQNVLHIPKELIEKHGTVSEACAQAMAENIQQLMNASIGISFTGNAGPDPIEGKPVGQVYIGLKMGQQKTRVQSYQFNGSRDQIRNRAVKKGLEMLYRHLKINEK